MAYGTESQLCKSLGESRITIATYLREGRDELTRQLTFLWSDEPSTYDSERGGFHVAIGPKLTLTR